MAIKIVQEAVTPIVELLANGMGARYHTVSCSAERTSIGDCYTKATEAQVRVTDV